MILEKLQKRVKGSRIFNSNNPAYPQPLNRLYFRYGQNHGDVKTKAWLEVVNDRIVVRVKVENRRHAEYYDREKADRYKNEIEKQLHELINNCELERRKIPLHDRLKDDIIPVYENSLTHQAQALRFACSMKVCALFADTGTGKTKIAIDLCVSRYEAGQIKKAIVFCPVSTKKNFREQIKQWCKNSAIEWHIVGLESMSSSDRIFLQTLAMVDSETQIIIDESHACKTPFAKRSKRIKMCCDKTSYKVIMTGTPGESVKDLYMQYAMLSELIIGERNWLNFEEKYLIVDDRGDILGYKNVDYLMGLVEPYTYQIRVQDCLNLPAKQFHDIYCNLNEQQSDLYEKTKAELLSKLDLFYEKDAQPPATLIFRYFTKLQQISCGFYKNEYDEIEDLGSGKFDELVKTNCFSGQTIFFCKYLYEVDQLVKYLKPENCAIFTGQNPKERDAEKDKFTAGEKQFFVATMSSGGTGLNGLQHCNRLIFWSNSFKYIERKQCIGRIDRQGQHREMFLYDMISNCGIEYRIQKNLARKGNLADEIKELLHDKTKLKKYVEKL